MDNFLQIFLPAYFIVFFGIAFVGKSLIVARRTGKNPLVLPQDDSAYGLVGFYFKILLVLLFFYTISIAFLPGLRHFFLPITGLENIYLKRLGTGLIVGAFLLTILAQGHMKDSWRIGIDKESGTRLITGGLFSVSRNPIFFGMLLSLVGLFLCQPCGVTLIFFDNSLYSHTSSGKARRRISCKSAW